VKLLKLLTLTCSYGRLHQSAFETSEQSLIHEELSFASRHRYNHLGLTQFPVLRHESPRFANTAVLVHPRRGRIFRLLQYYVLQQQQQQQRTKINRTNRYRSVMVTQPVVINMSTMAVSLPLLLTLINTAACRVLFV